MDCFAEAHNDGLQGLDCFAKARNDGIREWIASLWLTMTVLLPLQKGHEGEVAHACCATGAKRSPEWPGPGWFSDLKSAIRGCPNCILFYLCQH